MKRKGFLISLLIFLCSMFVFAGCGIKYNARLTYKRYDDLKGYINDSFLEDNRIYGANYLTGETEYGYDYIQLDETYPSTRTFIIKSQEEFDRIFTSKPQDLSVDFESQMLIIHTDSTIYSRPIKLKAVNIDGGVLTVKMKMNNAKAGVGGASMPCQIYLFIAMDKADITRAECELLNAG